MNRASDIRFALTVLGWSQQKAADQLDLNIRTINRYCTGANCPKRVLMALMAFVLDPKGSEKFLRQVRRLAA